MKNNLVYTKPREQVHIRILGLTVPGTLFYRSTLNIIPHNRFYALLIYESCFSSGICYREVC
jgi:hypothetical protein